MESPAGLKALLIVAGSGGGVPTVEEVTLPTNSDARIAAICSLIDPTCEMPTKAMFAPQELVNHRFYVDKEAIVNDNYGYFYWEGSRCRGNAVLVGQTLAGSDTGVTVPVESLRILLESFNK